VALVWILVAAVPETEAQALDPVTAESVVEAGIQEVWDAYTTRNGILEWQIDNASEIEMRIGSTWRVSYDPDSNLDDETVIENEILAFDPPNMWAVRTIRAPGDFPFPNAILDAWTVLYLETVGEGQTRVTVKMFGFTDTEESREMRAFFEWGNQYELDQLAEHLASR